MKFSGTLIVVKDIDRSYKFYHDLFGFELITDNDGNMILSDGLVLQAESDWTGFIGNKVKRPSNSFELYFEEKNLQGFVNKLDTLYPKTEYVNKMTTHSWGQTVVRFYDPDGNLIEVGTPMEF